MASNRDIQGITIKIQGDTSNLASSLNKVNKDINQTSKALKDVEKALKLDPSNVELLAQKEALLAKQSEQVAEKLRLEQEAAEGAKQALEIGDISAEEYATLQAEIAMTQSSLDELAGSASDASGDLEETGESAAEAGEEAEDSAESFVEWGEVVKVAAEAAVKAIAAVGAAIGAATTALVNSTLETGRYSDSILTMSTVTGVATDTLQEMNYATELLDVSTDTMTGAMTRIVKNVDSAADAERAYIAHQFELNQQLQSGIITQEEYAEQLGSIGTAYGDLGISVLDSEGELRDSEDIFWDVIDALGEIDNETERDAVAMSILGRSARDLNPLIEAGSEGFEALAQEAHETGYVMSGETLTAFRDFDDNMRRLENGTTALQHAFGSVLLPILSDLSSEGVGFLNEFTNAVLETNGDVSQLGDVIEEMLPQAIDIFNEYLPIILDLGTTILTSLIDGILQNLDLLLNSCIDIILAVVDGLITYLPQLMPGVLAVIDKIINFLVGNLGSIVTAALQIVISIAQGISNNLDTLIPAVVDAILEIAEALTDPNTLTEIIMAAVEIMIKLAEGLINAIPEVVNRIPEIIANIIEAFSQLGPELMSNAANWGADMIEGLVNGISSAGSSLRTGVSNVASTIASYLHFSVPDVGPLSDFDESGGDMIDTFIKGMDSEQYNLERSLYQTSDIIYNGMVGTDYTDALSGISGQIAGLGGGPQVINVWLGTDRLGSVVVNAQNAQNFRTGGTV